MNKKDDSARFAYQGLDRVFHEKARLGILTSLISNPSGLCFSDLKRLCKLTDGNLSRHIKILSESGLVNVKKGYEGNRPHTQYEITPNGQERFLEYIRVLERVVKDAVKIEKSDNSLPQKKFVSKA